MNNFFAITMALSAITTFTAGSQLRAGNTRELNPAAIFPLYNQQCRDDAGPLYIDDSETFGTKKYHEGKPAFAVGDCPDPLKGACAVKPKTEAFLEGPIDCGGKGWFCRILEEPGWPNVMLNTDVNFGYCNTTEGVEDAGFDGAGHCHGSDSDDTFYWWVRDHWYRQYNGRLRCCCGWDDVNQGTIVNRCDHRRLVTPTENLENCRDANEEGSTPYNGGCSATNPPALNQPIPENDAMCWEVQRYGEPCDDCGSDPIPAPVPVPVPAPVPAPIVAPVPDPVPAPVTAPTTPENDDEVTNDDIASIATSEPSEEGDWEDEEEEFEGEDEFDDEEEEEEYWEEEEEEEEYWEDEEEEYWEEDEEEFEEGFGK